MESLVDRIFGNRKSRRGFVDFCLGKGLWISERNVCEDGGGIFRLNFGYPIERQISFIKLLVQEFFRGENIDLRINQRIQSHQGVLGTRPIQGVKNVILISSGKGGVGKSTTTINLALALQYEGASVGILDADIYGPSQALMGGKRGFVISPESSFSPVINYGMQTMSIAYLLKDDQPVIWRSPIVIRSLMQIINETTWSDLDYLLVDLPPGTGDVALSIGKSITVAGSVVITTPQDISVIDARRGLQMFKKLNIPILGVIENMSTYVCPNCGHQENIFGSGGGEIIADRYKLNLLGKLPLAASVRLDTDIGKPTVAADPDHLISRIYRKIALHMAFELSKRPVSYDTKLSRISVKKA